MDVPVLFHTRPTAHPRAPTAGTFFLYVGVSVFALTIANQFLRAVDAIPLFPNLLKVGAQCCDEVNRRAAMGTVQTATGTCL